MQGISFLVAEIAGLFFQFVALILRSFGSFVLKGIIVLIVLGLGTTWITGQLETVKNLIFEQAQQLMASVDIERTRFREYH